MGPSVCADLSPAGSVAVRPSSRARRGGARRRGRERDGVPQIKIKINLDEAGIGGGNEKEALTLFHGSTDLKPKCADPLLVPCPLFLPRHSQTATVCARVCAAPPSARSLSSRPPHTTSERAHICSDTNLPFPALRPSETGEEGGLGRSGSRLATPT